MDSSTSSFDINLFPKPPTRTSKTGSRPARDIMISYGSPSTSVIETSTSSSESPAPRSPYMLTWTQKFITSKGNEYFCEIDEDYLTDRFNLTGLNAEIENYQYALDLVTDVFDLDCSDELREQIDLSARKLYGLVHARYITTTRGLQKMLEKFKKGDFGRCPRVMCNGTHMLPCGLSDNYGVQKVKLYCASCEDVYSPKSSKHSYIDGAYFGTTFHNMLFQVYPGYLPQKSVARYEPRVFGFKMHAAAALQRWQEVRRQELVGRLKEAGEENPFIDDEENDDGMDLNEGEEDEAQEL